MPMVSSKFRVGAFEGRIAMGFRLLDAVEPKVSASTFYTRHNDFLRRLKDVGK